MPVSIHSGQILKKKSTEFIHMTERSERLIERVRKNENHAGVDRQQESVVERKNENYVTLCKCKK